MKQIEFIEGDTMSRKYTVKINYNSIKNLIDTHKIYRGNNTSFCIDMGLENRTSWVSDLKRGRNFPSPEEAVRMCLLLNTAPEEILLHEGKTEKETAKCQKDIKAVRELLEKEKGIKKAPAQMDEGEEEFTKLFRQLPPEVQARELAYLRQLAEHEAVQDT